VPGPLGQSTTYDRRFRFSFLWGAKIELPPVVGSYRTRCTFSLEDYAVFSVSLWFRIVWVGLRFCFSRLPAPLYYTSYCLGIFPVQSVFF